MYKHLSIASIILFSALSYNAQASVILDSNHHASGSGFGNFPGYYLGQQFILNNSATIASVEVSLKATSASGLSLAILNDVSGNLGSTTYATSTSYTGTLGTSFSMLDFAFNNTVLSAGTYWLVEKVTAGSNDWQLQNTFPVAENTNSFGSITNRFVLASTSSINSASAILTINAADAQVPEPEALALLGLGLIPVFAAARKAKSRKVIA